MHSKCHLSYDVKRELATLRSLMDRRISRDFVPGVRLRMIWPLRSTANLNHADFGFQAIE